MPKRASPWTVTEARAMLKALAVSGLSVHAFAERHGFDEARVYRWRRLLASERQPRSVALQAPAPAVIELRAGPRLSERVEIALPSGITLRVSETIAPSALSRFIAALR